MEVLAVKDKQFHSDQEPWTNIWLTARLTSGSFRKSKRVYSCFREAHQLPPSNLTLLLTIPAIWLCADGDGNGKAEKGGSEHETVVPVHVSEEGKGGVGWGCRRLTKPRGLYPSEWVDGESNGGGDGQWRRIKIWCCCIHQVWGVGQWCREDYGSRIGTWDFCTSLSDWRRKRLAWEEQWKWTEAWNCCIHLI